jgi:glycosyltransferase involved in cell wall biosynthesis
MTDVTNPALSVMLVTYNHAKYVAEALESILMQRTDFDFEIVAIDDCSNDSTLSILKEYEKKDARLRVLSAETNLGISRNYQRGFAACRGEYIAVLEGDDYWISPRKLQATLAFLNRNPHCSFCFHRVIRYEPHPETVAIYPIHWTAEQLLTASELASGNFIGGLSTCVYRREIIAGLKVQLWDLDIREWFFNIVVAEHGPIGYVPQILSVYRAHPGGISSMRPAAEIIPELIRLIGCYNEFLDFRFTKEFQSFTQRFSPGISIISTSNKIASPLRVRIWVGYWRVRIWIASRLPVRVKRILKQFVR